MWVAIFSVCGWCCFIIGIFIIIFVNWVAPLVWRGQRSSTNKIHVKYADTTYASKILVKDVGNTKTKIMLKQDGADTIETNKVLKKDADTTEMILKKDADTTATGNINANKMILKKDCESSFRPWRQTIRLEGKLEKFYEEMSRIVGLADLKLQLRNWAKGMLLDEKRRATRTRLGARKPPHMAFLGNPGTGKTTVARILGRLLHSVGVLSSDKVTEVQRTDLVGEYIGRTGIKTRGKITQARGGILFVDEAYRLVPQMMAGQRDFGVEALEEIMSVLDDDNITVIFAGYTEPMKRVFSSNQGFCRRMTKIFQFDDFTSKDLAEMLMIKMEKQDMKSRLYGFKLHPSCNFETVLQLIEKGSTKILRSKLNGGLVDHMLNNARENLDSRLSLESNEEELFTITLEDLEQGLRQLVLKLESVQHQG